MTMCPYKQLEDSEKIKDSQGVVDRQYTMINHRTAIRTGITCKKIPCYMRDPACRWLVVKNVTIF